MQRLKAARAAFEGPWSKFTRLSDRRFCCVFATSSSRVWQSLVVDTPRYGDARSSGRWQQAVRRVGCCVLCGRAGGEIPGQNDPDSFPGEIYSSTVREPGRGGATFRGMRTPVFVLGRIAPALATGCHVVLKP